MSWNRWFELRDADHYRSIVLGLTCPLTQLLHHVFLYPLFATLVRRPLFCSTGNLKGRPQ
jgi:hypothetical protein